MMSFLLINTFVARHFSLSSGQDKVKSLIHCSIRKHVSSVEERQAHNL